MQAFGLISLMIVLSLGIWWMVQTGSLMTAPIPNTTVEENIVEIDPIITAAIESHRDVIVVATPTLGGAVQTPLTITGKARGYWFFEGSFPVVLTDWDGKIIAESYATAEGEWMTESFVPFTATIAFDSPYQIGDPDFMRHGTLILRKDNPSGLPEHDDALEIPVVFGNNATTQTGTRQNYGQALDAARQAADSLER